MTAVILRAGELDRRVTLQTRSTSMDSFGQQISTWTDWATVWANIKPASGRELLAAGAVNSEVTHTIVIRYRPGVLPSMRAIYGAKVFDIHAVVEPKMAHVSLELMCSVGLNQGG